MAARQPGVRRKAEGAYHHGDLKASLRKAALRLVREKGAKGFSLNEASRMAGVSVGAPYRHFADKDALLADIAREGCDILAQELTQAAQSASDTRDQMLQVGMAYLLFSKKHADYFAVVFGAGLDKKQYPEVERSAQQAFNVIWDLARKLESTPELVERRATSAWALVHGLATLAADGALSTAVEAGQSFEHLKPLLWQFLNQPLASKSP